MNIIVEFCNKIWIVLRKAVQDNCELFDRLEQTVCHDYLICFVSSRLFAETIIHFSFFCISSCLFKSLRIKKFWKKNERKDTWGVWKSNCYMIRQRKHHRFIINEITINRMASCRDDSETRTPAETLLEVCICFHKLRMNDMMKNILFFPYWLHFIVLFCSN